MDRIEYCIQKGMHITKNPAIVGKMWHDFELACKGKKVILYGIGNLLRYLWIRCQDRILINAAIDNDAEKQGFKLGDFFDNEDLQDSKNAKICQKSILQQYQPEETVILISSQRYYEEIAADLDNKGFHCYFSILNLEYHYREYMISQSLPFETEKDLINKYVKYCVEKYPVEADKVVFFMDNYLDHGKYITESLLRLNKSLGRKINIVWLVNRTSIEAPAGVKLVQIEKWRQYIKALETAKIWIYSVKVPTYLIKRESQIYIQTKHWGSLTLKKFASYKAEKHSEAANIHDKWIDYIITGSEFDEDSCRKAFNFEGQFLRFGSSRSDIIFRQDECKAKIYKHFNLAPDERILLYAPTRRFHSADKNYTDFKWQGLNFDMLLTSLKQRWTGNWKIFLRLHPTVRTRSRWIEKPDFVIDVSGYGDAQELIAASDILISDYSSIIFEASYVAKPIFLYAPDKIEYINQIHDFLIDYDSLPFPISMTNQELSKQIVNFNEENYQQAVKNFLKKYSVHEDGHASERTAKFIINDLLKSR